MAGADPDWALWRSFAAVVAEGSLSAAGRRIGYSQPTLGRHIETLEQQLGVLLFDRTLQGLKPTATALRLYEPVRAAEQSLAEAALVAEGSAGQLEGTVRVTSSTVTVNWTAATDNVAVTGYRVSRDGSVQSTVTGLSFSDSGLTASTSYN